MYLIQIQHLPTYSKHVPYASTTSDFVQKHVSYSNTTSFDMLKTCALFRHNVFRFVQNMCLIQTQRLPICSERCAFFRCHIFRFVKKSCAFFRYIYRFVQKDVPNSDTSTDLLKKMYLIQIHLPNCSKRCALFRYIYRFVQKDVRYSYTSTDLFKKMCLIQIHLPIRLKRCA